MNDLLTAVREGRKQDVPALVLKLDPVGRRAALTELKALRKEAQSWEWQKHDKIQKALLVAGAGCHTGAAGCAAWMSGRALRDWVRTPYPLVLEALADRDPAWLADLAHRLAARSSTSESEYWFISELARIAQCPVPVTDSLVVGWTERVGSARWRRDSPTSLLDILRAEPHLTVLAPRLFELQVLPPQVGWFEEPDSLRHWPAALTALAEEGLLDRGMLVDGCVTRLLRGGKPGDQRCFLVMLRRLALTEQEETERIADWMGMAADGISTVAGHAQEVLIRLDGLGLLTLRDLAEVSGSVLFRSEKKLVRGQLVFLGKVLRRDASTAGELLPVIAEALGHEDTGIQERALKLIARHLPAVDGALREELALAAGQLGPMHRSAAVELFGELPDEASGSSAYEEQLPPAPALRRLEPAPESLAELVEEVAALTGSDSRETTAFERALDGMIRHARTDRTALAAALREALSGHWLLSGTSQEETDRRFARNPRGLDLIAASVLGRVSPAIVRDGNARWTGTGTCTHAALDGVLFARMWEAAAAVRSGQIPFLLATPTWHTGSLDARELVERLRTYQRLGAVPGPADFAQALLRVRRAGELEAAEGAALLGTPEGDRLAAWIRADEPVARVLRHRPQDGRPSSGNWWQRSAAGTRRVLLATKERPVIQREFPRSFHWLGRPHLPEARRCYHWEGAGSEHWLATLPEDGETMAAWLMPDLMHSADEGARGAARWLPALAEAGGPAGGAIHLALGYGLGARHAEDRLSAVDALLVLAAQGRLDAPLLGRELSILVDHDLVKLGRLTDSARTAAATGAYRTVLSVLVELLPPLLAYPKSPYGLGETLAVTADCAERSGAPELGPIDGLTAVAGRKSSSQLVRQAGRLLAVCGAEPRPVPVPSEDSRATESESSRNQAAESDQKATIGDQIHT
ncbi:DUF6493 family protein [Streptomyces sp. NBC_00654]|uniref:DUF7824 domain-containing protein n=1 Tax=Streptomyces sp. NBC_00654 TaxID=2975799 RepID=UPI00225C244E|nr:DUF6493 family protein [Streptomyces sp. NBC_00654]MCX4967984.1 DUF6493 family protein [Streptomyces sp. NBC_00654]